MRLVNTSGNEYDAQGEFGLHEPVAPGAACEIADGYCRAGVTMNGSRRPSIVEQIAPFLLPADETLRAKWGKEEVVQPPTPLTPEQQAAKQAAQGQPPAVAAMIADGKVELPAKRGPGRPPKVRG